jgi:hypothetical protein
MVLGLVGILVGAGFILPALAKLRSRGGTRICNLKTRSAVSAWVTTVD